MVAEGTQVVLVLSSVVNRQHEGASGEFPEIKTLLSDGVTAIDESSGEADSIGTVPPEIVWTPQAFAPVLTPVTLVAGEVTDLTIEFTVTNPWPADGQFEFTLPDSFTKCDAQSVAITSGVDGTFTVAQTGVASTFTSTQKDAGGEWTVTISRAGDGAVVAAGDNVVIVLSTVTNMQFEGSSGEFPSARTLTAAGEAIDEASGEADSIGTVPPAGKRLLPIAILAPTQANSSFASARTCSCHHAQFLQRGGEQHRTSEPGRG